jgi:hypothetical protein
MFKAASKVGLLFAVIYTVNFPLPAAHATNAYSVQIGQIIVGRSEHEVQFSVIGNVPTTPCANVHSSGIRYMFSLNRPDGQALLSTLLTAKTTGTALTIVGTDSCNTSENVEFISYLWLI